MAKPKIKDLLALLKDVSQGIKDLAKNNQSVQNLGQTVRRVRPQINAQSAHRSGLSAGHIIDVVRENAQSIRRTNNLRSLPSLGAVDQEREVKVTTRRVLGYERILRNLTKEVNDKSLLAAFPGHIAERMDSYIDKYQKMLKDVEKNADLTVNRADMANIKSDVRSSYRKAMSIAEKIYAGGYLNNSQLTAEQIQQANVLLTQLEIEHKNIDAVNKAVRKSTRMAESIADMAERKKEQYNRAINNTFQNIHNIGRSFASRDLVGMASGMYGIARMGIKAATQKKARFEGEDALNKQLGGLSKALGKLAILKIVLEGLKAITSGAAYFSDQAADMNKQITDMHSLTSQGISMEVGVNTDQLRDSFGYYRKLFMEFGADTKTWLQPEELLAISSAMEPYGTMLKDFAGSQEQFNQRMLSTMSIALNAGMAAPEMAGHIADFSQQFGTDLSMSSAYLDVFRKSANEADIPARFMIEGIKSASADLSVAGESILWSMEMQKKNLKSGNNNTKAGAQAFEAYMNALKGMSASGVARLRDQLGSGALTAEADKKLAGVNADIASGKHTGDALQKLKTLSQQLQIFKTLNPAEQAQRFTSLVGARGVDSLIKQVVSKKYPEKLKALAEGKATLADNEDVELRTLLEQTGVSDKEFDTVVLGLANSMELSPEDIKKKQDDLEASYKDANKTSNTLASEMEAYMTQQTKLSDIAQSAFNKILSKILRHTENILAGLKKHPLLKGFVDTSETDSEKYQRTFNALLDKIMTISQMESGPDRLRAVNSLNSLLAEFKSAGGKFQELYEEMKAKGIPEDILQKLKGAYDAAAASTFNNVSGSGDYSDKALAVALDQAGIKDATERAAFLGQMAHESGNFNFREEQISEAAAERKYGAGTATGIDLGNTQRGDGYKYRGRGYVQLTGKWNYGHYGKMIGVDLVNNPDLAADPAIAARIAIAYWNDRVKKGKYKTSDFGNTRAVTAGINPGLAHLKEREAAFRRYQGSSLTQYGSVDPKTLAPAQTPKAPTVPGAPSNQAGAKKETPKVPAKGKSRSRKVKRKQRTTITGSKIDKPVDRQQIQSNALSSSGVQRLK